MLKENFSAYCFFNKIILQISRGALFGAIIFLSLIFGRLLLIFYFRETILEGPRIWDTFFFGFRALQYDAKASAFLSFPLIFIGLGSLFKKNQPEALLNCFYKGYALLILALTQCLSFANFCFFQEYHTQFNHWIFGLIYDDFWAILSTIWQTYPLFLGLLGILASTSLSYWLFIRAISAFKLAEIAYQKKASLYKSLTLLLIFLLGYGVALRGSIFAMPLRAQHVEVTPFKTLNSFVLNPYMAIYYALKEKRLSEGAKGLSLFWPNQNIHEALGLLYPNWDPKKGMESAWEKKASGNKLSPLPKHIFFIVMESQNAWPMIEPYTALELNPYLTDLKKKGISVDAFLSAGSGTMPSLAAIISGLYDAGLNINYQGRSHECYPTSIAPIFKRLGYTTRFIYGGYLSWQRIGDFCQEQGFDEILGGGNMGNLAGTDWGVSDLTLFDYILNQLPEDRPSFNLIMTSTNHPPYPLSMGEIQELGWEEKQLAEPLKTIYDGKIPIRIFAHTWYTDQAVGHFIEKAEKRFDPALFVITGDHTSRKFLNEKPSYFEKWAVPCIFYSKNLLNEVERPVKMAGDHLDIAPTLIELVAPAGFSYHSFGKNLMEDKANPTGYGCGSIITPEWVTDAADYPVESLFRGPSISIDQDSLSETRKRYNALRALAWWQVFEKEKTDLAPKTP